MDYNYLALVIYIISIIYILEYIYIYIFFHSQVTVYSCNSRTQKVETEDYYEFKIVWAM